MARHWPMLVAANAKVEADGAGIIATVAPRTTGCASNVTTEKE
jgi:hypothetical protein